MTEHVVIVAPDGGADLKPVAAYLAARAARAEEEAARIEAVKARGKVPSVCGDEIPEAPARGPFQVFEPVSLYPTGEDEFQAAPSGYRGRSAMRCADTFDVMAASAARRKRPAPFTPGQVAMGRHYRDLVERHACAGLQCSSIEAVRSGGSGQGGAFMDAVLRDREEIERLRRRVGSGYAMQVRRVRPSDRNRRQLISDLQLVDMVCIEDRTLSEVLEACGWVGEGQRASGKHIKALRLALGAALDRMAGPVRQPKIVTL